MAVFTISTTWLGPAAAIVSGGWQLQELLVVFMPSTLTPTVTDSIVRSSSFSTHNLLETDFLSTLLLRPLLRSTTLARCHLNQFSIMSGTSRMNETLKRAPKAT